MRLLNGTKIDKRQFTGWLQALRSGKYDQAQGDLQTKDNCYCCLGVACLLTVPKNRLKLIDSKEGTIMDGGLPEEQENSPDWLKLINDDFYLRTSIAISDLNDDHGFTFVELADLLEAVYVEGVLGNEKYDSCKHGGMYYTPEDRAEGEEEPRSVYSGFDGVDDYWGEEEDE